MESILVKKLYRETDSYVGKKVKISGWVRTIRDSKSFAFMEINDGSFFKNVQIVIDESVSNFKEVIKLPICSSLSITGTVVETPGSKQPFEIKAEEIVIEGLSSNDYPLQKKRHSVEYLRTIALKVGPNVYMFL